MAPKDKLNYELYDQIGFILRKVNQRHTGIFSELMPEGLTPTRFAALVKLHDHGTLSQNELGRLTAMDVATIKGVVDRLRKRGLIKSSVDPLDARRQLIQLTEQGTELILAAIPVGEEVTRRTISPLTRADADRLGELLKKIE